jgi:hypothetical protein
LKKIEAEETNPLLKTQIAEYGEFIKSFTSQNAIMNKSFFVVVPFDGIRIPGAQASGSFLRDLFSGSKKSTTAQEEDEKTFNQQAGQLAQRTEQVITGLAQVGLRSVALRDDEIIELLYNLYNPESIEKKGVNLSNDKQGVNA